MTCDMPQQEVTNTSPGRTAGRRGAMHIYIGRAISEFSAQTEGEAGNCVGGLWEATKEQELFLISLRTGLQHN